MNKILKQMLACPNCNGSLVVKDESLICEKEQLIYPIINGISVLLPELGEPLEKANLIKQD